MNYKRARVYILPLTIAYLAGATSSILPVSAHIVQLTSSGAVGSSALVSPVKAAEQKLKEMGESIHRTKSAAVDLVRECTRENTMMAGGEIDFIGTDVIPILPDTSEGLGGPQFFPPRRQYIDLHMGQLSLLLPILQQDIASMKSPDPAQAGQTAAYGSQMTQYLNDAMTHFQTLKTLASASTYDSASIVNEATALHKDVAEIDKVRKKVYGEIKHDPNDKALDAGAAPANPKK
jgi:hypothetical protein